ncbi:MAG TPA: hypothetical protein VEH49_05730 [Methylomirabilota bacterium]|nr:hypothetical protein [Methylomirabilota bacterium]
MNNVVLRKCIFLAALVCLSLAVVACGGITGTYTDQSGSVILEVKSGGQANLTFMNETETCTYTADKTHLTLTCKEPAGKLVFTIHDDGTLTGPPGSFMPPLKKK